jgi:hypothetical protein
MLQLKHMKKIIIGLIILGLFMPSAAALAKFPDDLPVFSAMPDSVFYFLKIWYEKVVLFFTFDLVARAERYKTFAEKRAYEADEMIKEGKPELAAKLEETYKFYLNKAKEALEKAIQKAIEKQKEELKQELDKKVEEIMNKLKESIHL